MNNYERKQWNVWRFSISVLSEWIWADEIKIVWNWYTAMMIIHLNNKSSISHHFLFIHNPWVFTHNFHLCWPYPVLHKKHWTMLNSNKYSIHQFYLIKWNPQKKKNHKWMDKCSNNCSSKTFATHTTKNNSKYWLKWKKRTFIHILNEIP